MQQYIHMHVLTSKCSIHHISLNRLSVDQKPSIRFIVLIKLLFITNVPQFYVIELTVLVVDLP